MTLNRFISACFPRYNLKDSLGKKVRPGYTKESIDMKKIYIASYHQSVFGKLFEMSIPEIVQNSVLGVCKEIDADPSAIDVGSIGATCNMSLNEQGLLGVFLRGRRPGLRA